MRSGLRAIDLPVLSFGPAIRTDGTAHSESRGSIAGRQPATMWTRACAGSTATLRNAGDAGYMHMTSGHRLYVNARICRAAWTGAQPNS